MRNEQGVIISLIVFIVLTLVFGVATYFGAKGYQEQKAALETARSELASATAENDSLRADLNNFKEKLGYGLGSASEIIKGRDGAEKRLDSENKEVAVHYNGMTDDVVAALGSDATFKDAVAKLVAEIANVNKMIAASAQERDENIRDAQTQILNSSKEKERFDANAAKMTADHLAAIADSQTQYAELTSKFNEQTKEFDVQKRDARKAIEIAKEETKSVREASDRFAETNLELSKRIDLLTNNDFERADAFVVSTDQVGKIVRLSVGSKDGVRPLTKFNVFPKEALEKGGVKAKASVQVLRSLEDHCCEARILTDDSNNPIEPGDLVFTPLWRPGEVYKYALDYHLDVNHDGVSDLGEVYNMIQLTGGEVVAYIDDDGSVHGKITPDVYRIIVADESIIDRVNADEDMSAEDKKKLEADVTAFANSATENGVVKMHLLDLMAQIGYKKTDELDRYHEEKALAQRQAKNSQVSVGGESVIPVYSSSDKGIQPGSVLPVFPDGADEQVKAPSVTFRKRVPKN